MNYEELKFKFRLTSDGDPWGTGMAWLFAIADEIYFNREALEVPTEWQFRPSPCGPSTDDDYYSVTVSAATDEGLNRFGALINRYLDCARHAGLAY